MDILLIDDDRATLDSVSLFISDLGHTVECAQDGVEGVAKYKERFYPLVFTDIKMPNMDGFGVLNEISAADTNTMTDIVFITGNGDIDSAVRAMREGAYDYLQKPINIEELALVIERVAEHLSLKQDCEELTERFEERVDEKVVEVKNKIEHYKQVIKENMGLNILIHSKKLEEIFELAEKFHASPTVPVLIEGETGTGKDLLARYIHFGPDMVSEPFIAINCAAIPTELFESELFGHEAGAFTGANAKTKKGQFEIAENGTLLLDEIGDMPLATQVKLLRVLEDHEFYRVGGVKRLSFNARIIAATNKSLQKEVEEDAFRSDLFHRLNVGFIRIPPLRERREEIVPLAHDFLAIANERHGKSMERIEPDAEKALQNFSWPGNVRQLQNAIERVVLLHDGDTMTATQLRFLADQGASMHEGNGFAFTNNGAPLIPPDGIDLDDIINKLIEEALRMAEGKKTAAAKLLNISPRTIARRMERSEKDY